MLGAVCRHVQPSHARRRVELPALYVAVSEHLAVQHLPPVVRFGWLVPWVSVTDAARRRIAIVLLAVPAVKLTIESTHCYSHSPLVTAVSLRSVAVRAAGYGAE